MNEKTESESQPWLTLRLGDEGEWLDFAEPEELQTWLREEQSRWEWLGKPEGNLRTEFGYAQNRVRYLESARKKVPALVDSPDNEDLKRGFREEVEQQFHADNGLHSEQADAAFVLEMHERFGVGGGIGAISFFRPDNHLSPAGRAQIALALAAATRGPTSAQNAEYLARTHRMTSRVEASLSELEEEVEAARGQARAFNSELQDKYAKHAEQIKSQQEHLDESSDATVTEMRDRLDKIHRDYDQYLSLQRPIRYWEGKKKRHTNMAIGWGITLVAAGLIGGYGIFYWLYLIHQKAHVEPWEYTPAAVTAGLVLLGLRILSRVTMSNLHLASEAGEREVMAFTYLSLMRRNMLDDEADRHLVLQAIFRPSTTGLVKEDAVPPSMLDLASRISDRR